MSFREKANLNEVWQDADGCCYTPYRDGWLSFGTGDTLYEDDPLVTLPMIRLLLDNGDIDIKWVNPRIAYDRREAEEQKREETLPS